MRIAVTGGPGQLVLSLAERGPFAGHDVIAIGPPALDLAVPQDATIYAAISAVGPDIVVNAAAHTAVDRAESERDLAFAINAEGAGAVARSVARLGLPLVHVSTDYVFDGDKAEPYTEADMTGPTGVYGESKLAGERAVLASGADAAILRTAWVYSPFGANFVKTMLRLAQSNSEVRIVSDQRGNPTNALDLADAVIAVAVHLVSGDDVAHRGLFHAAGTGEASWADLAEAVFAASASNGGPSARVTRIATADYPTPAKRPPNSTLDCTALFERHGIRLPIWQESAAIVTARLVNERSFGV